MDRQMDEHTVRHAYDTVAADYARLLPDTRAEAQIDLAMIDDFLAAVAECVAGEAQPLGAGEEEMRSVRVLDAGCGAGRMSGYLAERKVRVEGVDLSPGMVDEARRSHPRIPFEVASLTGLPHGDASLDGVLVWYSAIHTPPAGQPAIFAEVARVVRPGGLVLVGFQSGAGVRDVSASYGRFGHTVELVRYLFTPDEVARFLGEAGLEEVVRLVRRPRGNEKDDQAFLLARRGRP
jgi:SAM-dependent methyltransferase